MSEYTNVERPFLDKLRQLGWEVIDHGTGFIPQDPAVSRRRKKRGHSTFLNESDG
jgi:type I restriction enzyme R subunit